MHPEKRPPSAAISNPRPRKRKRGSGVEFIPKSAQSTNVKETTVVAWNVRSSTRASASDQRRKSGLCRQVLTLREPTPPEAEEHTHSHVKPPETEEDDALFWETIETVVPLPPKRKRNQRNDSVSFIRVSLAFNSQLNS
jgi:hypothetical protein